ncbi:MAG: CIA30 family protein [Candidatus Bathyarchaeota archaeon]|nr:CIA30 family protein [Candidatus Bathyarchaeum sp.]
MFEGTSFNLTVMKNVTWLWSPLFASIFIPLVTYHFLKKLFFSVNNSHVFLLGLIGFMVFPTFWLISVSVAEMVGVIFLYVNLFFITFFISDNTPYRGLFLVSLTTIATVLIHPFSGTFALIADLLALPFHFKIWRMKNGRYILLLLVIFLGLLLFPIQFTVVQGLLFNNNPFQIQLPSLESIKDFWLSTHWLTNELTADSICSESFNWIRYVLLFGGFCSIKLIKNDAKKRTGMWLFFTVLVFLFSWFIVVSGITNLPYGTHRFARVVDISLIPFAAFILYIFSTVDRFFVDINNASLDKINNFKLNLAKKLPILFSQKKIFAFILLTLSIFGMLSSFYLAYSIPLFDKNVPAEPGRPTWRTVSADEMKIVQLINSSSGTENYCILANGFIPKLVAGNLGYRYVDDEPNLALAAGTVRDSTSLLLLNPDPFLITKSMVATNSTIAFFVTEDWYVKGSSLVLDNFEKLKEFAADYTVIGTDYKFYFFKFDLATISGTVYKYTYNVDEYDIQNPTLIADDEQATFWSTFGELDGTLGIPVLSSQRDNKISGNYSTEARISNGTNGRVGFYRTFEDALDLSSENYISFYLHGDGSAAKFIIYMMAPTPDDSTKISFTFDWDGWRFIKIPLMAFVTVRGNPDLSAVTHISIQFTDVTGDMSLLIDKLEVSK